MSTDPDPTAPVVPDTRQTIQLCADLISASLSTKPEGQDPDLVHALAACTRFLTLASSCHLASSRSLESPPAKCKPRTFLNSGEGANGEEDSVEVVVREGHASLTRSLRRRAVISFPALRLDLVQIRRACTTSVSSLLPPSPAATLNARTSSSLPTTPMTDQYGTKPADLIDSRHTVELCANLISSSLQRTNPEAHDPNIVNALAACTRWLTLNGFPAPAAKTRPRDEFDAAGTDTRALTLSPRAPGRVLRWSSLPFELVCRILHVHCAMERDRIWWRSTDDPDAATRTNADMVRDVYVYTLVCRGWEPAASSVLWESVKVTSDEMFVNLAFGSFCSSFRLGQGMERAGSIRFLDFPELDSWRVPKPIYMCFFEKLQKLRRLKLVGSFAPLRKLVSLRPPLRRLTLCGTILECESVFTAILAACPTIRELDLGDCHPITDLTLAVLKKHPPLHCLDLSDRVDGEFTIPAIDSFLRARTSELRYLSLDWTGPAPFAAIASGARNVEHITVRNIYSGAHPFTWDNTQFVRDLVRSCTRLKTVIFDGLDLEDWLMLFPDGGRVQALLDELGVAGQDVYPFCGGLFEPLSFAGVAF
ncbi:hypothetical protein BDK51DRAFT_47283 [Blyttiomyces helicus]|uniref:Uncharacterized protein n=1 Tax=Blyttiomyces helicus TaxID=388810 RepID=A0A4P9W8E4_9FUNG|nr:hypothetical protein BDK51DRAFT_47283 [Blyttiomyces helicus]|eukprot:RKO88614.1 hypothetical protein BDK51DRAFT_47283 [Blyttiomyces helicus]